MNKSMLVGTVLGVAVATAAASFAGYQMLTPEEFAEVVSVTPITEEVSTPREVCHDEAVTQQKPVRDQHRVIGTVIGAVAGGVIGNELGGDGKNTGAKIAGAAAGGLAGNKIQQKVQESSTYTTTESRCTTVSDVSQRTVGYQVSYRIGEATGQVQMDHDPGGPGTRLPLRDGQLVLNDAS